MRLDHLLSRVLSESLFREIGSLLVIQVFRRGGESRYVERLPITSQLLRANLGLVAQLVRALC